MWKKEKLRILKKQIVIIILFLQEGKESRINLVQMCVLRNTNFYKINVFFRENNFVFAGSGNNLCLQEVKEKSIRACGLLVSVFGDVLQTELAACLLLLMDRLRNEMTRLTTVKG